MSGGERQLPTSATPILQTRHRKLNRNEPTSEPESLRGHLDYRMGDMVDRVDRLARVSDGFKDVKRKGVVEGLNVRRGGSVKEVVGGVASDKIGSRYYLRKKETRVAYEQILRVVRNKLGDQQIDVIMSAADEVIGYMKDTQLPPGECQSRVTSVLGKLTAEQYSDLRKYAELIVEIKMDTEVEERENYEGGVSVFIDEEEEESEYESESSSSSSEVVGMNKVVPMESVKFEGKEIGENGSMMDAVEGSMMDVDGEYYLDPRGIDAYWLQRMITNKLKKEIGDGASGAKDEEYYVELSQKILEALGKRDARQVEGDLLELLDYERFDLIKLFLNNRTSIYYCTRLKRAESKEERMMIEEEMEEIPGGKELLYELQQEGVLKSLDFQNQLSQNKLKQQQQQQRQRQQYYQEMGSVEVLDLEALSFQNGSHFLSTDKKCRLPMGWTRQSTKDYEQVFVPGVKPNYSADNMEECFDISLFPEWAQLAFQGIRYLNPIQTKVMKTAFESSHNMLLCAPTGAGKTNVAMLCVLHELGLSSDLTKKPYIYNLDFKVIYIAPMKSLVQEMVDNFSRRLKPYGMVVREFSGDSSLTKTQLASTHLIVTTPEKWDIITRRSGDRVLMRSVRLIIVDEIHMLHDERGPVLEAIVSRTIRHVESTQKAIRLVGLSATLPNYPDVALFLRVESEYLFAFGNDKRPIPLEQYYVGINVKQPFKRYRLLNQLCYEKLLGLAGQQVLIFVHSRKETVKTASYLLDTSIEMQILGILTNQIHSGTREILREAATQVSHKDLARLLPYGFAIHNASMTKNDRTLVEDLFSDKHIQILVSTSTLAWGVNLPAHGVIIKGTQVYNSEKGDWTELSSLDVMQMLGRAGRPQYDIKGVGIVLTTREEMSFYLYLLNQQLPIESQFVTRLADNLNAEIVLGTIQTIQQAIKWLGYTYLYVRMLREPSLYGVKEEDYRADPKLNRMRHSLIHTAAMALARCQLIKYDRKSGLLQSTELGRIASNYYIPYQSMNIYNEHVKISTGDIELLRVFSLSKEFQAIQVRADEQSEVEKLIERVPIPIKESSDDGTAKVNLLLQTYISRLGLEGYSLMSDMVYITQSASRIMRCLFEIALKRGWAQVAEIALSFCKMIEHRLWITQSALRQFEDIPDEICRKLEKMELSLERLQVLKALEIAEVLRLATKFPKVGSLVYEHVRHIPKLQVEAIVLPMTRSMIQVELTLIPDFNYVYNLHGPSQLFWIMVVDVDGVNIIHYQSFILKHKYSKVEHTVRFTASMFEPTHPQYFIKVYSDRWFTSEMVMHINFKKFIAPERFPMTRSVLDLQPATIAQCPYANRYDFEQLNNIQTQTFNSIWNQGSNVLICAASGSGKTTMAEFAIQREWEKIEQYESSEIDSKFARTVIVYITPVMENLNHQYEIWKRRFDDKRIFILSGEIAVDTKLLDSSDLVLSSPEHWDILTRKWKKRRSIFKVCLFIVDDLHWIGSEVYGFTLETIITRMRYISELSSNAEQNPSQSSIRFIGLSYCIANANTLGEWMGVSSQNIFNFSPSIRPTMLEVSLQSFEHPDLMSRFDSILHPLLFQVERYCDYCGDINMSIILFTPSIDTGILLAEELITRNLSSMNPKKFLIDEIHLDRMITENKELIERLDGLSTRFDAIVGFLKFGIGVMNEVQSEYFRSLILSLFENGIIGVLICSHTLCYDISSNVKSGFVAVVGAEYYEGKSHGYISYDLLKLFSMLSKCGNRDKNIENGDGTLSCGNRAFIYCHSSQKEFYKKFLSDPFPVESQLHHSIHDYLISEIYSQVMNTRQEAMDYLTWTLYYRRLVQNPNYYHLENISQIHISDHLSELIDQTLIDLQNAKCVVADEGDDISILNNGIIAAYYNIKYTTIELFNSSLSQDIRMKSLIHLICNSTEFESNLCIRHKEDRLLKKLALYLPMKIEEADYFSIPTKVNVLLQCHFSRQKLPFDLQKDQKFVLLQVPQILQALVDVISSSGWLSPAISTMELSQMIFQAMWEADPVFKQLPYFTNEVIERLRNAAPQCETIFDIFDLDDQQRKEIFQLNNSQLSHVASICNRYPNIELIFDNKIDSYPGEQVTLNIRVNRDQETKNDSTVYLANCPFYPKKKIEHWWFVIGDQKQNILYSIKRLPLNKKEHQVKLTFETPRIPSSSQHHLNLLLISDSWVGCDQDYPFLLTITTEQKNSDPIPMIYDDDNNTNTNTL